jgi:hypothetical protein
LAGVLFAFTGAGGVFAGVCELPENKPDHDATANKPANNVRKQAMNTYSNLFVKKYISLICLVTKQKRHPFDAASLRIRMMEKPRRMQIQFRLSDPVI